MELTETINTINRQLENLFGSEITGRAIFRVVWSEDQYEKRMIDSTKEGLILVFPILKEVKKYSYIKERYVLEQLVGVPEFQQKELGGVKISYEPLWVFQNAFTGEYLPPLINVAKFVIDGMLAARGKKSMRKYVDDAEKNPIESRENRINKLQAEMFGEDKVGPLEHKGGVFIAADKIMTDAASPEKGDK